jgi:hypothetical protein
MDKRGPGSLRGLGSFEGVHPPFIDLTLMPPRAAVHCLHAHAARAHDQADRNTRDHPYVWVPPDEER